MAVVRSRKRECVGLEVYLVRDQRVCGLIANPALGSYPPPSPASPLSIGAHHLMGMQLRAPRAACLCTSLLSIYNAVVLQGWMPRSASSGIRLTDSESLKVEPRHLWFKKHPQMIHAKF